MADASARRAAPARARVTRHADTTGLPPARTPATSPSAPPARPARRGRPGHADRHRAAARSRAVRHARQPGLQRHAGRRQPGGQDARPSPTPAAGRCTGPSPTTPPGSRSRPASGTDAGTITVTPSISGLTAGTYTATVTVSAARRDRLAASDPGDLHRRSAAAPPALAVSPSALVFSAAAGAADRARRKAVNVTNTGGGTLTFTASADVPVAERQPAVRHAPRTVSVTPSTAGLAPGTYTGTVTIAAAGVSGSPKTVAVTFTVTAGARLHPARRTRRRLGLRRGERHHRARRLHGRQQRHDHRRDADRVRPLRRRAELRRRQRLVTIPDANSLRPHDRHDAVGVGQPRGQQRQLAHRAAQGAHGRDELLAVRQHRHRAVRRLRRHAARVEHQERRGAPAPASGRTWRRRSTARRCGCSSTACRSPAAPSPARSWSAPARCGSAATPSGREWFSGLIDEVRVYNRALAHDRAADRHGRPGHVLRPGAAARRSRSPPRACPSARPRAARARRPRRSRWPIPATGRSTGPPPRTPRGCR